MIVSTAAYTQDNTSIHAVIDGMDFWVPDDMTNGHRIAIAAWEEQGNAIAPCLPTVAPVAPLPRLAFWLAAVEIGVTKAGVKARIEAMSEGVDKAIALVYLDEAQQYRRNDPLLNSMAQAEGITQVQLDMLWTWALDHYV